MGMSEKASHTANAMLFDGTDFLDAAGAAARFAGADGRIATMADVVQARRVSEADDLIWQAPIVTASAEYFGLSRGGTPIIVVAHGIGPLADEDGVFAAYYGAPGNGKPRNGVIGRDEFLRLESGAYGPAAVVPFSEVRRTRHPFQECLSAEEAMEDPLVRARLGEDCDFYLARHRSISLDWVEDKYLTSKGHECMLASRDPQMRSYLSRDPDDGVASAHLLAVSGLVQYDHGHWDDDRRHSCLVTFLSCHEWGDTGNVIGYRGGHVLRPHPGPALVRDRFREVWPRLLKGGPPPLPGASRIHALMGVGGLLFTRHEASGCGPQGGEPEYPVKKAERTDSKSFRFPVVDGDYRNPRCDAKAIRAAAPPWANAFRVVEARTVWEGDLATHHVAKVDYYRIDVSYAKRIPSAAKLREDFDLILSIEA